MNRNASSPSGGVSVIGLLGVLFVGLKLTGYIDWSWWWVTAPFWIGFAIAPVVLLCLGIGAGVAMMLDTCRRQ